MECSVLKDFSHLALNETENVINENGTQSDVTIKMVTSRYFCGGSFCFMSWCIKFFVLLAPYVCFHILVKLR